MSRPAAPGGPPRRLLVVALHFPPANASGTLRTLKFSRYLPQFGWLPTVITVTERCHDSVDPALLAQVPPGVAVRRVACVDSRRTFAVAGHYPALAAVPDPFVSWLFTGVPAALRALRADRAAAVFSTSPVPTAHLIALLVARRTGTPWIADFRDPWGSGQERGRLRRRVEDRLERLVLRHADRVVATTPELLRLLERRAGSALGARGVTIHNGYDEEDFAHLDPTEEADRFTIVHGGALYPVLREPTAFFHAVRLALDRGALPESTRVHLLGPGPLAHSDGIRQLLTALRLAERVQVSDRIPYAAALRTMNAAAVLLLLQGGREAATQIPNKAYEYLRLGRPILCVAPAESATTRLVRRFSGVRCVDPDDVGDIARALSDLAAAWQAGRRRHTREAEGLSRYSRLEAARTLAALLDDVASN